MIKRTDSTGNWLMYDSERDKYNLANKYFYANDSSGDQDGGTSGIDFLSNGFKNRNAYNDANINGAVYIYAAFAEQPFKYSAMPASTNYLQRAASFLMGMEF